MSQHDLDVANQTFPNHRADVNLALKALGSNQSGSSAPGTTFANMMWYDTGNNILKMRNEADDAWIDVINLNQSATTAAASMAGALTTSGDMLYAGTAGANTRLAIGSANQIIRTDGLVPSWGTMVSGDIPAGLLVSGHFTTSAVTADVIGVGAVTATKIAAGVLGHLVQEVTLVSDAVSTATVTLPYDDSIPQNDEGVEFMTLGITPISTNNDLLIDVSVNVANSSSTNRTSLALFQGTATAALAAVVGVVGLNNGSYVLSLKHRQTVTGTDAHTFRLRVGPASAATITINGESGGRKFGGVSSSSMSIREIS